MALKGNLIKPVSGLTDYSKHLQSKPIMSTITVEKKSGGGWKGAPSVSQVEHPGVFCTKNSGCMVEVSGGRTINIGNFESARIDVSILIPCDPELVHESYEYGTKFVSDKIEEACKQVK